MSPVRKPALKTGYGVRLAILALLALSTPAFAQEPTPMLDSLEARRIADWVSTATVSAAVTLDVVEAWRADDRGRAFVNLACRQGVAQGVVQVVKMAVPRWRPNGTDRKSFFSAHSATAAASGDWAGRPRGWQFVASVSLTDVTAMGRMLAGAHHPSDVGLGVVDGLFASWLCDKVLATRGRPP